VGALLAGEEEIAGVELEGNERWPGEVEGKRKEAGDP
jgi:hypothetical protein